MKKLLSISLALSVLSFAACKKSSADITTPTSIPKLKTITIVNGGTTINTVAYEYDNSGRLTKVTYMNGVYYTYTYAGSTMHLETFSSSGASQYKYTYSLNTYGAGVSYYDNNSPTIVTNLTFNLANQFLTEITNDNGTINREEYYGYDNAGNRLTDSLIQATGTTIRKYEYYTDKISTISNANYGNYYDGAGNKNCLKKITSKSPLNVITTILYSIPELDAQDRVTKQSYTIGGATTDYLYTYY